MQKGGIVASNDASQLSGAAIQKFGPFGLSLKPVIHFELWYRRRLIRPVNVRNSRLSVTFLDILLRHLLFLLSLAQLPSLLIENGKHNLYI